MPELSRLRHEDVAPSALDDKSLHVLQPAASWNQLAPVNNVQINFEAMHASREGEGV